MKISAITSIILLIGFSVALQGQDVPRDKKVGICDLQGAIQADDPAYVRIIQPKNANTSQKLQWADVEPEQGVYDFSGLDKALKEIQEKGRYAIIKLNANDKPDWLFDIVPYHPEVFNTVEDTKGTLMYWHPNFIEAYINLLEAYGKYLETSAYLPIISGIRLNFNSIGTEQTYVAPEFQSLGQWIIPAGVDSSTVEEYTSQTPSTYKDLIVDAHIELILPSVFVYVRTNSDDFIVEKNRSLFESGQMGFFHTGASMEENQVFNNTHRYARFMEFCLSGKTRGFTEMCGFHEYTDSYNNPFPKVQWNYWRLLSDMHCGVSMSGFHTWTIIKDNFDQPEYTAAWNFADRYLGFHADPKSAPGAWVALRGNGDNFRGDYRYLMEREGDHPTAPLVDNYPGTDDGSYEVTRVGSTDVRYGAWARALPPGKRMTFHVNPDVFYPGEKCVARVVYFDSGTGSWQLMHEGGVKTTVSNKNTGKWTEREVLIETNGNTYEIVNTGSEAVIFHMLEVKRDNQMNQFAFESTNRAIPGLIEAEHYDEGGEGVAWHDDTLKNGDATFRPEDMVDVVLKAGASNDYVVGFTSDKEWLEYTVDVTTGVYDIILYYYCGETPGELVVSLNNKVLEIFSRMENSGWEHRDSISVGQVSIEGGNDILLHLEFANGAGFDIDAIRFNKVYTYVTGVALSVIPTDTLFTGDHFQLQASVVPISADNTFISWSSSDPNVASVDANGIVTAHAEGSAIVTVTTAEGEFSDSCKINVKKKVISVYGVTIGDCPRYILETGDTYQLLAQVAPPDASDTTVTWTSSVPSVVSVDANGLVFAKSQGSATISIMTNDGGYTSTCNVGVMSTGIPVTGVTITDFPASSINIDSTFQLKANVAPDNAGDHRVTWSSSDETVAIVDEYGWMNAIGPGSATMIASTFEMGCTDSCVIHVNTVVTAPHFDSDSEMIKVYPNPVSDFLNLSVPEAVSGTRVRFYNVYGQLLYSGTTCERTLTVDIRKFFSKSQLFIVKINGGNVTGTFKIIAEIK